MSHFLQTLFKTFFKTSFTNLPLLTFSPSPAPAPSPLPSISAKHEKSILPMLPNREFESEKGNIKNNETKNTKKLPIYSKNSLVTVKCNKIKGMV